MAKPEWGAKRSCPSCAVRFYDLLRDPVACPSCGASFPLSALTERKPAAPSRAKAKPEKAAAAAVVADSGDALIDDDDDSEEDAVVDDVLLDDDDDDDDDDLSDLGAVAGEKDDEET
ncbi:TIGR02300 family protein [Albimonas donghaensis]|uniref:TIGR02300 family protein n=1 Tax=Albimonas donghaensis TaxID=356660 RepID=A0A1H3D2Z9_9RHOB|nr:TIGR02300 family protein [Albimonas donghaensis]SDX60726.1 TIGR02300 family protein [Albimonas donghaensis]